MGLFGSDKPKVFKRSKEIEDALKSIDSLDISERKELLDRFRDELDHGGVSEEEFREVLKDLRTEHRISDIDRKHLEDLLD